MFKYARVSLAMVLVAGSANLAFAQGQSNVQSVPNATKYKNSGVKPATGRSGSATLEARALLAKNGTMLIEASTGSVEDGAGPGQIAKAQVKINGVALNFNGLSGGGYWAGTFPGTSHKTVVQVQTNVRGIDPKRTGVVTVTTPALLRPDIAVTGVSGPATHKPLLPVEFVATVKETNGDVGARANCVISINGTPVDTANGIWIDANGTVACQFMRTFTEVGTYTVSVAATGVTPGDWDTSNNSASTTIEIVEPNRVIKNGNLQAYQRTYIDAYHYRYNAVSSQCWEYYWNNCYINYERNISHQYSSVYMNGWTPGGSAPLQRVDAEVYTNGQISHSSSLTPNQGWGYDHGYYSYSCRQYYNDVWNGVRWVLSADRFSMCADNYVDNPQWGGTSYRYQFIEGDVVYYGSNTYCGTWGCNSYTWQNYGHRYGDGTDLGWTNGTEVRLKLAFVDESGKNHTMDKSVTLNQTHTWVDFEQSNGWTDWYWDFRSYRRYLNRQAWGNTWWND